MHSLWPGLATTHAGVAGPLPSSLETSWLAWQRLAQIELDAMGIMIENKRGTPIPNPLLSVIDTLERRQLAIIRSMSLNQTASDPRTINGSDKIEGEARAALRDVGVAGLIAQPAH